jgi:DNA polymerase III subunit epsilon
MIPTMDRPVVSLDLETTGTAPDFDRIVEIGIVKVLPDGTERTWQTYVDPGCKIPCEATEIHGIDNAKVKGCPTFAKIADTVAKWLNGCDIVGYSVAAFDLPMLAAEFGRLGRKLPAFRVVDAFAIFRRTHPRDLTAAVRRYLGRERVGAHGALDDAREVLDVLKAQMLEHADLPRDFGELAEMLASNGANGPDSTGRFVWRDGEACFAFGKNGKVRLPLREAAEGKERGYLEWMLGQEFPADVKDIIRGALAGEYPKREKP